MYFLTLYVIGNLRWCIEINISNLFKGVNYYKNMYLDCQFKLYCIMCYFYFQDKNINIINVNKY